MRDAAGWVIGVTAGASIALGVIALGHVDAADLPPSRTSSRVVAPPSRGGADQRAQSEFSSSTSRAPAEPASATQPATAPDFDPRLGVVVYGTVTDAAHQPIAFGEDGAYLWLTSAQGDTRTVPIDQAGDYSAPGLPLGGLRVRLVSQGFLALERTLVLTGREPVVRMDLVLERTTELIVRGVTRDGQPLLASLRDSLPPSFFGVPLWAMATAEAPEAVVPACAQRALREPGLGRYRPGGQDTPDMMGRLELAAPRPLSVSIVLHDAVLQTRRVDPGEDAVSFMLDVEDIRAHLGTVRLRVIDAATGQPLPDATAALLDDRTFGGGIKPDVDGVFLWPDQSPGQLILEVKCPDHQSWGSVVQVPDGGMMDFGDVALDEATTIAGVVQDAAGERHAVQLDVRPVDTSPEAGTMITRWGVATDALGAFRIADVGRRDYELSVHWTITAAWTAPPQRVSTRGGNAENVVIVVERGSTVRLVADWPSTAGHDVEVRAADGSSALRSRTLWGGDVQTGCLAPGRYTVSLRDGAAELRSIPFEVGADAKTMVLTP